MISPESQGGPNIALITIACGWTFVGIAMLGVSLLIWSRQKMKGGLGLDDYLTTLALVTTIALIAQTTWAIADEGQDNHEAEISTTKFVLVVRSLLVNQTLWGLVNTFVRMSAILFIERVFGTVWGTKWKTRSLLVLSILYGLAVFLEAFLICRPMAVDWNARIHGTCGDQIVSYLVLEVFGLFLDFTILVVPLPTIWGLQLVRSRKVLIAAVFSIGALVFIVTGLRIQALHMVNAEDFTYSKGYLGLLSALGASLGIIFCCAPVVPFVYDHWRGALLERASTATRINESSRVNEISLPMTEDHPTHPHGRRSRRSIDIPPVYQQRREASHKCASKPVHIDEENTAAVSEIPYEISLRTTGDDATQTHGRSAQSSMENCITNAVPLTPWHIHFMRGRVLYTDTTYPEKYGSEHRVHNP